MAANQGKNRQDRVKRLIHAISDGLYEREEVIAVALLAALCGQNTFLFGPPGTAKSLISRRIACAFHQPSYFEYLMHRFSTPEEVFGPVSIKALKEDNYIRKTASYLPAADFAFLDEIWKSSPAILNTLLTLINERTFKNGEASEQVPLKALLAASNETPDVNQGLEALYDRFIVRLLVPPISQQQHFERLLSSKPGKAEVALHAELPVRQSEWSEWLEQMHMVKLSPETLTTIHLVREKLAEQYEQLKVYVSDRRWQRAATLLKGAAFFNGRSETNHSDALLLTHCLWTQHDNRQGIERIVESAVQSTGFESGVSLAHIDSRKEALDREISRELFYTSDVYKTVTYDDKQFLPVRIPPEARRSGYSAYPEVVYIPYDGMKSRGAVGLVDDDGNEYDGLVCKFDGQGVCKIEFNNRRSFDFVPDVLFHKGDKKAGVNDRLVQALTASIQEILAELQAILAMVRKKAEHIMSELESIFVPPEKSKLALAGITQQIESLEIRVKDCERLDALCK